MSALMPLLALVFLGVMGWALLRMIGGPGGPETFNPNSCSSCSSKQGGQGGGESLAGRERSEVPADIARFPVASEHYRLNSPR